MRFVEHFSVIFPVSLRARSLGKSLKNALVVYLLLLSALLAGCKVTLYSDLTESEANQMLALLMMNRISAAKQQNKAGALTLQVEKSAVYSGGRSVAAKRLSASQIRIGDGCFPLQSIYFIAGAGKVEDESSEGTAS